MNKVRSVNSYPNDWPPIITPSKLSQILNISRPKADKLMARRDSPTVYITESFNRVVDTSFIEMGKYKCDL